MNQKPKVFRISVSNCECSIQVADRSSNPIGDGSFLSVKIETERRNLRFRGGYYAAKG